MALTFITDGVCGSWSLEIKAMDPILMSTGTLVKSDGLMAIIKGSPLQISATATQSLGGFCLYVTANEAATNERALCLVPVAGASGSETKATKATSTTFLTTTVNAKKVSSSTAKMYPLSGNNANIEWAHEDFELQASWDITGAEALEPLAAKAASAVESYIRASYWVPKASVTNAAGVPPKFNLGIPVTSTCMAKAALPDVLITAAGAAYAMAGTAVTAGGPTGSYVAGNGAVVLTRPSGFTFASGKGVAVNAVTSDRATSGFEQAAPGGYCQGAWLKIAGVSSATWTTDSAEATLKAYTNGLRMTISQRQAQAYQSTTMGFKTGTSPTLCVKLGWGSGMTLSADDTNVSAICMYTLSQGVVPFGKGLGSTAGKDADTNGFKTLADAGAVKHQQVHLQKPASIAANFTVGSATGAQATPSTATDLVNIGLAGSAELKRMGVKMTGPGSAANCISAWMGAGDCLLTYSLYLPKASGTAASVFTPKTGDKFKSYCAMAGSTPTWKLLSETESAAIAAVPANDSTAVAAAPSTTTSGTAAAGGATAGSAGTAPAAASTTVAAAAPKATGVEEKKGGHAKTFDGSATTALVKLQGDLDVNGMLPTAVKALSATAQKWTDGYTLTSRITMLANNATTGTVAVCYACTSTGCLDKGAYCHGVTGIVSATSIPANAHTVVLSSATLVTAAKMTVVAAGTTVAVTGVSPVPTSAAYVNAEAALKILTPIASSVNGAAAANPVTAACNQCLVKPATTPGTGRKTDGLLAATWMQPITASAANGPRFDTGATVTAWGVQGVNVVSGTAVTITKVAAALATGLAGVAAGAAALAM